MVTFTTNKNLSKPANGAPAWDTPTNHDWDVVDVALGGVGRFNLAGASGQILLNSALPNIPPQVGDNTHIPPVFSCVGAIANDVALVIPAGITGHWIISNFTTNPHSLWFSTNAAGANSVSLPQGLTSHVYSEGTYVYAIGTTATAQALAQIGEVKLFASPFIPATWLLCAGQPVSRTTYSLLFAYIGNIYGNGDGSSTFNVPDMRGRVAAGADNMGGGFAGRLNGWSIGVNGGASQSALTDPSQLPWHDHGAGNHGHGANQDGHQHAIPNYVITGGGGNVGVGAPAWGIAQNTGTDWRQPTVNIANSGNIIYGQGSSVPFNIVQPTQAMNYIIYAGA
jgi:microcystin-dependent protein